MGAWDVGVVETMYTMLSDASSFEQTLYPRGMRVVFTESHVRVANVSQIADRFSFNQPLPTWNVSRLSNLTGLPMNIPLVNVVL